jgi:endonuclease-3
MTKNRTGYAKKIIAGLAKLYPEAACELDFKTPHQLLVATILSAQCTDKRVNAITPALFKEYKSVEDFAEADPAELEKAIHSAGFFRQKAKWIISASQKIVSDFEGKVPGTMEALLSLSGVARKTANVILGTAYGLASGVVVDTHVIRLSKRLGLSRNTDPVKIEKDLMALIPREQWIWFAHAVVWHGRRVCKAASPNCAGCPLQNLCPSSEV